MSEHHTNVSDAMYGQFIKYDRLYEMTKYAFYGCNNLSSVNIFIDVYSLVEKLYRLGSYLELDDSYSIASCIINLSIHLRAYFESRHRVNSKIFIVYGGANPNHIKEYLPIYNNKNILATESNKYLTNIIKDNLDVIEILTPYLYDIYSVVDYENEFNTLTSFIIDNLNDKKDKNNASNNIIYSKDTLSYQLVAFKPFTFLYRPKKSYVGDNSWVVTKSTLYNAYRNGELGLKKIIDTDLHVLLFSMYQAISGVRSRSLQSIKSANTTISILENGIENNRLLNGYNPSALNGITFELLFKDTSIDYIDIRNRYNAIDLQNQTTIFKSRPDSNNVFKNIINLYDPDSVRNINSKYFQKYPLDLNRV